LLGVAATQDLDQLWIMPEYAAGLGLPPTLPPNGELRHTWVDDAIRAGWEIRPAALAPWLHCYRPGRDGWVDLAFPGYMRDGTWAQLSAADLTLALQLLDELTGVQYRHSPENTSSRLLTGLHRRRGGKELEAMTMPLPALDPNTEADLSWIRPLYPAEEGRAWVRAWDVNAAYLSACSSLRTGVGEARYHHFRALDPVPSGPGYFFATVEYTVPAGLPNPFPHAHAWITHPTLELAYDLGVRVTITDAWVWDEWARPLEPWYRVLRDARGSLMNRTGPAAAAALVALKRMWGPLVGGRVASTRWDRTGDALYRPDWRHFVIATTRARLYRALLRLAPEDRPFAVATDCAYFARHDRQDVPDGLRVGTTPGSFKPAGTCRLDALMGTVRWDRIGKGPLHDRRALVAVTDAMR
jgi:hypothetical protein